MGVSPASLQEVRKLKSPAWEITLCPSKRFRKLKSDALANARTFYTSRQDSEGSCAPQ